MYKNMYMYMYKKHMKYSKYNIRYDFCTVVGIIKR